MSVSLLNTTSRWRIDAHHSSNPSKAKNVSNWQLFEPGGALGEVSPMEQNRLKAEAAKLAEVFQRSSSNVEGRNGYLSLRNHQLRGLDHPRKRACLTAIHNFFLTRPDGTAAAERFFGQKPRSMFAAILASVDIPPTPLSPPRRAVD